MCSLGIGGRDWLSMIMGWRRRRMAKSLSGPLVVFAFSFLAGSFIV